MPNDSQADLQKVVDKVSTDPAFGAQLANHPKAALESLGIEATDARVKAFKDSVDPIKKIWEAFGMGPGIKPLS